MGAVAFRELGWAPLAAAAGCLLALAILVAPGAPSPGTPQGGGELEASIAKAPLSFEPNAGRTEDRVDFLAHSVAGGSLYLTSREAVLALPQGKHESRALRLGFRGADPDAPVRGLEELPGRANTFIGDDPSRWRSGIPTYERVRYEGIYPGIDLDFYGDQRDLEYDFRVGPGADPSRIAVRLSGADSVRLDRHGDLLLDLGETTVRQRAPVAYQEIAGERRPVRVAFDLDGSIVGFSLGHYDRSRPLVIDPLVLAYSTYLGGGDGDTGNAIAIDSNGAAYVAGETVSANFPTQDAFQTNPGANDNDAFVTKLDPESGGALTLAYSTYLGGSGNQFDFARGVAVDPTGAAYVTGGTQSTDFPTKDQFMSDPGDMSTDAFVTKLNPDSGGIVTLDYSTYLGGNNADVGHAIAVDEAGAAYVGGTTGGTFPVVFGFGGTTNPPGFDGFVTKFNPHSSGPVTRSFSTYLGGSDADGVNGIAVGSEEVAPGIVAHPVYVVGVAFGTDFPTEDAFQPTKGGGTTDTFVTKLNLGFFASAVTLDYSSYLGGGANDTGKAIAVDSSGAAYVTGETESTNFPTVDPRQGDQPFADVFVTRVNPEPDEVTEPSTADDSTLAYSTYLGGAGGDSGNAVAVDSTGAPLLTGSTNSSNFPTQDSLQGLVDAQGDAFVTRLAPDTGGPPGLEYSTLLGGNGQDFGTGIAVDAGGAAYVAGRTSAPDFPTQDQFQGDPGDGQGDAFVARLVLEPPPPSPETPQSPAGRTVTFDASKAKGKKAGQEPLLAVRKGRKASFSGDVSAPQDVAGCESNQTVELQRKRPKQASFTTFDRLQTDAAGSYSTKKKIKKTFEYRAVLAETAACDDAASQTEKVKAKKRKKD